MGLFGKKEEKNKKRLDEIPKLPELPELPEFPTLKGSKEDLEESENYNLPSLPNNFWGEKFSQNVIKDAITGGDKGEEVFNADEFADEDEEEQMMHREPLRREIGPEKIPVEFKHAATRIKKDEPFFVRLDKFEESINLFENAKGKIAEIEKLLRGIKNLKEQEEKELQSWTEEINSIKQQIEKIDREIFSKID